MKIVFFYQAFVYPYRRLATYRSVWSTRAYTNIIAPSE